ncbi:hypothetical protein EIP86_000207 [Pleurotus ostreatoroseus]|nr:hypothetical protein EIP86_000207 [Pleurotus ostreatoroseus]
MSPIAARIPPELFENILCVLMLRDEVRSWSTDFVSADKRELSRLALVCRYWAEFCQDRIFHTLILRTHSDYKQFLAFLQCPLSRIHKYVSDVSVVVEDCPKAPWLHRLSQISRTYRIGLLEYHPKLEGSQPNESTTAQANSTQKQKRKKRGPLRSIHHSLPKTFPSSESSHIMMLDIKNQSFRSLSDLVHLLTELRALRDIELDAVIWAGEPALPPAQAAPKKGYCSEILSVKAHACSADWVAAWMLAGLQRLESVPGRFAQERCIELLVSVESVQQALSSTWNESVVEAEIAAEHVDYGVTCSGRISETEASCMIIGASVAHTKAMFFYLTVSVDISITSFDELLRCDWLAFDKYMHSHKDDVLKVILGFKSRDDMKRFLSDVAPASLPWLSESGRLVFAVRLARGHGVHNDTWAYATVKEEEVTQYFLFNLSGAIACMVNVKPAKRLKLNQD